MKTLFVNAQYLASAGNMFTQGRVKYISTIRTPLEQFKLVDWN